jgi:elongation factor P hydroxylase
MISPPPIQSAIQNENGVIDAGWSAFMTDVYNGVLALQQSGTTAKRPTKFLYAGRMYFDTSLGAEGKPIWYSGTSWRLADGTAA